MADMRMTMFFECNGHGWTETHVKHTVGVTDLKMEFQQNADAIALKRSTLLGEEAKIVAVRLAYLKPTRGHRLFTVGYSGVKNIHADSPDVCVVVNASNAGAFRSKVTFQRGGPDDIAIKGGQLTTQAVGYADAFNLFWQALIAQQYGWMGQVEGDPTLVAGYVMDVNEIVTVTFQGAIFAGGDFNKKKVVRFSGINGKSPINGSQVVVVTNATTCKLFKPLAVGPYKDGGQGRLVNTQHIPYAAADPIRISERKVGAPFFKHRGRAAKKARV